MDLLTGYITGISLSLSLFFFDHLHRDGKVLLEINSLYPLVGNNNDKKVSALCSQVCPRTKASSWKEPVFTYSCYSKNLNMEQF